MIFCFNGKSLNVKANINLFGNSENCLNKIFLINKFENKNGIRSNKKTSEICKNMTNKQKIFSKK